MDPKDSLTSQPVEIISKRRAYAIRQFEAAKIRANLGIASGQFEKAERHITYMSDLIDFIDACNDLLPDSL